MLGEKISPSNFSFQHKLYFSSLRSIPNAKISRRCVLFVQHACRGRASTHHCRGRASTVAKQQGNPKNERLPQRKRREGKPLPYHEETKISRRRGVFAPHQSLPLWGARLQATVEFCKQNIECRTYVRRMRCSPFSRYKIWTPHPPLSWSPFSRWRRLAKKTKTSRRGGLSALRGKIKFCHQL